MKYQRVTVRQLLVSIGISHENPSLRTGHDQSVRSEGAASFDALHAVKLPPSSISALFAGLRSVRISPFLPYDKSIGRAVF